MLCFVSKPTPQSLCNTVSEFSCRIQCVNSDKSQLQLKVRNNKLGENYRGSLRKFPLQAWRKVMCTAEENLNGYLNQEGCKTLTSIFIALLIESPVYILWK